MYTRNTLEQKKFAVDVINLVLIWFFWKIISGVIHISYMTGDCVIYCLSRKLYILFYKTNAGKEPSVNAKNYFKSFSILHQIYKDPLEISMGLLGLMGPKVY